MLTCVMAGMTGGEEKNGGAMTDPNTKNESN